MVSAELAHERDYVAGLYARLDALREFHLARVRYETALGKP